jgi:hypothetical protein
VNAEIMGANESRLTANNHRSPGLFNALARGFAEFVGFDRQPFRKFAPSENLQSVKGSVHESLFAQELLRHVRIRFELLEITQVHQRVSGFERRVVKTALRQPPDKWHLTALEPKPDAASGTSFLPLMTFAARFAVTGTFATPESLNPVP